MGGCISLGGVCPGYLCKLDVYSRGVRGVSGKGVYTPWTQMQMPPIACWDTETLTIVCWDINSTL